MRGVGHLVGTIFRMLYVDVLRFIVIYGVVLIGFACAAFLLATGEFVNGDTARIECEYCTLQHSMLSLFRLTLGDFDYAVTFSKYGAFGVVLFIAFSITSNILLLNLLIALLNNTFVKADTDQSYLWRLHRAQYILTVERRLWCNWRLLYLGHLGRPKKLTPTDSSTAGSKVWQWLQKHVLLGLPCHKETDYLYITYERQADYYHRPAAANGTDKKAAEAAAAAARSSSTDTNNA